MYEVFLNERRLILAGASDGISRDENIRIVSVLTPDQCAGETAHFLKYGEDTTVLLGSDCRLVWEWFRKGFREVPAAGGIVRSEKGVLFLFRRRKWDLPKGKIDANETPVEAALREVSEETGLTRLTILGPCSPTYHLYFSNFPGKKREWILKKTYWFTMQATEDEVPRPETAEDIEEVQWVPREQVDEILGNTYANLKKLIVNAYTQ